MTDTFEPITIPRDRWSRPLVIPPQGGKPIPYTRATTYVDCIEDRFNLQKWMQRMVAVGIATRPDLHLAAASMAGNPDAHKKQLDEVCESAMDAAKGGAKATIGTALHAYIERINLGQDPGTIPADYTTHITNYTQATTHIHPVHVERFVVQDDLLIGGTPDLIAHIDGLDGTYVLDLKTGPSTLKYGSLKVAMQMAVYAHSDLYTPDGQRHPLTDINQTKGVVIALDSDTGACALHWVDLAAGWEAVQIATQVRTWRARKNLITDYTPTPTVASPTVAPIDRVLYQAIQEATDRDTLLDLWGRAAEQGHWTDAHTQASKIRLDELNAA